MKNNGRIVFWITLLVILICCILYTLGINYINKMQVASIEIKANTQPLSNMPVPKYAVRLKYEYEKTKYNVPKEYLEWRKKKNANKDYIKVLEDIKYSVDKGYYIYSGSSKEMSFFKPQEEQYNFFGANGSYLINGVYFDDKNNLQFGFKNEANMSSSMRVSDYIYAVDNEIPLLGFYQPGNFIFRGLNNKRKIIYRGDKIYYLSTCYVSFEYNDKDQVSAIKSDYIEYKFDNYKYFKGIDMTIPTEITWNSYYIKPSINIKNQKRFNERTEKIKLLKAERIEPNKIDFVGVEKPINGVMVTDMRSAENVTYEFNNNLKDVSQGSKIKIEEKEAKQNKKGLPIYYIILEIITLLVIFIVIYKIYLEIKK